MYLPILHLARVELNCKLQEKLLRVRGPLVVLDDDKSGASRQQA